MKSMFPANEVDPLDFSPPLLRLQDAPPNPLGRKVLWLLLSLLAALLLWAILGRLDIVAVAEGKLIPESYVKIVQPAESGIVKEILVREGQAVKAGQVPIPNPSMPTISASAWRYAESRQNCRACRSRRKPATRLVSLKRSMPSTGPTVCPSKRPWLKSAPD